MMNILNEGVEGDDLHAPLSRLRDLSPLTFWKSDQSIQIRHMQTYTGHVSLMKHVHLFPSENNTVLPAYLHQIAG
jgi:hypothetical protein